MHPGRPIREGARGDLRGLNGGALGRRLCAVCSHTQVAAATLCPIFSASPMQPKDRIPRSAAHAVIHVFSADIVARDWCAMNASNDTGLTSNLQLHSSPPGFGASR